METMKSNNTADVQVGNTVFHYSRKFNEVIDCVRCEGTGSANQLTYPDQCGRRGCKLCKGSGKTKVECIPTSRVNIIS